MVTAFVLAMAESGKERQVLAKLKKFPEIKESWNVYGEYDILMKIEVGSLDKLNNFLMNKLRGVGMIHHTTTMIAL
jgi:DNA-binding Lrp family transcriptional regulator